MKKGYNGGLPSATVSSRKDVVPTKTALTIGILGLSMKNFRYDPLVRSFRPCEQSSASKSGGGEALDIGTPVIHNLCI